MRVIEVVDGLDVIKKGKLRGKIGFLFGIVTWVVVVFSERMKVRGGLVIFGGGVGVGVES